MPDAGIAALSAFATPKSVTSACDAAAEDVRRLDVAMDDAALMRVRERVDDVVQDPQRLRELDSRPCRASAARSDSPSMNGIV